METKVTLREATPDDIEEIVAVQADSPGAVAWAAADYANLLGADGTITLLAEDREGKRVAGFLVARTMSDEMEILNLAVAPEHRRRGIGQRLLAEALARARVRGSARCWLEVRASNQPALAFYRALGFARNSRRPRYYRNPVEDGVVCVRPCAAAGPAP